MTSTSSRRMVPEKVSQEGKREREFFRYSHCVAGLRQSMPGDVAKSSPDAALTAFAQLVYVAAEATRTLSLQLDAAHDSGDQLWLGRTSYPRANGLGALTLQAYKDSALRKDASPSRTTCTIPDLRQDVRTLSKPCVVGPPFAHFYAGAPIVSPAGYAIGSVCCYGDDERPQGLTDAEKVFMGDIAMTVTIHLEMTRSKVEHARSVEMLKGLSRFMEGKQTLDDTAQAEDAEASLQNSGNSSAQVASEVHAKTHDEQGINESTSLRTQAFATSNDEERADEGDEINASGPPVLVTLPVADSANRPASPTQSPQLSTRSNARSPSDDKQEALLSHHVRSTFERAARIVQKSMDVNGLMFLDASDGQFGGLRNSRQQRAGSSERSDFNATATESESDAIRSEQSFGSTSPAEVERPCRILGAAFDNHHNGFIPSSTTHSHLSESFLKSLLRRFPYGKIWDFDKDGFTSSDDFSDESVEIPNGNNLKPRRLHGDDSTLFHTLFPGVRSLAVIPVWDSLRERFFAGTIVWTNSPVRILTFQQDINYLGAFVDCVMAEVGRLDAHAEVQAKTSFVSSISHELRSPLHGILGAVECLLEKDANELHDEMIQMIDTCGRSLLDIINNVLQVTHNQAYNRRTNNKASGRLSRRRQRPSKGAITNEKHARRSSDDAQIDLAVVTEEVLESALWSDTKRYKQRNTVGTSDQPPVKVALEIDGSNLANGDWCFSVDPGAWRRIVLNLVSNSLKYTDKGGFVKVKLSATPPSGDRFPCRSVICLLVEDSGRGMGHEYLSHGLWKAFSQEDHHAQGTGLGLSLVHSMVKKAGGKIELQSEKGVGTTVVVSVPVERCADALTTTTSSAAPLSGYRCALLGFESEPGSASRGAKARNMLGSTLLATCSGLGLRIEDSCHDLLLTPDLYLIAEEHVASWSHAEERFKSRVADKACVVLCNTSADSHASTRSSMRGVEHAVFLSQPYGPKALVKAVRLALERAGSNMQNKPQESSSSNTHASQGKISPTSESAVVFNGDSSEVTSPVHGSLQRPLNNQSAQSATSSPAMWAAGELDERSMTEYPFLTSEGPTSPQAPPTRGSAHAGEDNAKPKSATLLLVDDNNINLQLLTIYMKKNSILYMTATNGLEALDAYKAACQTEVEILHQKPQRDTKSNDALRRPTIILMDITMPVMDGLDATRRIRAHEQALSLTPSTIIALTALTSADAEHDAYSSGVNMFLTKPVKLKELGKILGRT